MKQSEPAQLELISSGSDMKEPVLPAGQSGSEEHRSDVTATVPLPRWDLSKAPPMMRHYLKVKEQYREHVVLYQVGDFYEIFFEDAQIVSAAINIRLTSRDKVDADPIPMCGIPIHALDNYLPRLLTAGLSCVVFSQVESSVETKGILKREITRVVTPGVRLDGDGLEGTQYNYLAALALGSSEWGSIAFVDVSTGHLRLRRIQGCEEMVEAISRVQPSEIILPSTLFGVSQVDRGDGHAGVDWLREARKILRSKGCHQVLRPFERLTQDALRRRLETFVRAETTRSGAIQVLGSLGPEELTALGALFDYIEEVSVGRPPQLAQVSLEEQSQVVVIDESTRRNLEILESGLDRTKKHSLLGELDSTQTAMGARLLGEWLLAPSCLREEIEARHDAVGEFKTNVEGLRKLVELLARVRDLDRLASRVSSLRISPKELVGLAESLEALPLIGEVLADCKAPLLCELYSGFEVLEDVRCRLREALADEPPTRLTDGGIFREGYREDLDRLRRLSRDAKQWLAEFEESERKRTGISALKVRYNNVFGYFIEISKSHLAKVPADYERKQTLANAERYVTSELKEHEQQVLSAKVRQVDLEKELFIELRLWASDQTSRIQAVSQVLAKVDVLQSLASIARSFNYVRPQLSNDNSLVIAAGRHPVVERVVGPENFVCNDTMLDLQARRFAVLTGPNMGGKSTYLRQIGLIQLMAQAGSFVPAEQATLPIVDRIFTRIGASDDLTRGDSTFMVEMREAAIILRKASNRSLVLIDEIGRGTATRDGLAIATAIAEWLLDYIGCKTVFATHFHELTELGNSHAGAFCLSVGVVEQGAEIEFTHRIEERPADRSYGIEVARLAGLPERVVNRAGAILETLNGVSVMEVIEGDLGANGVVVDKKEVRKVADNWRQQLPEGLVELVKRVERQDLNRLTPIEALMELSRLQQLARETKGVI